MKTYNTPKMIMTTFAANDAVAAECQKSEAGHTDPLEIEVLCIIGGQHEYVFSSSCRTSASSHGIVVDYVGTQDYFVWYTGHADGDIIPSDTQRRFLDRLVTEAGFTAGPGWHYAAVNSDGSTIWTDSY